MNTAFFDEDILLYELQQPNNNIGQNNYKIIFIGNYVIKCTEITKELNESYITQTNDNLHTYALTINKELNGYYPNYYYWSNGLVNKIINIPNTTIYVNCIIMDRLDGDLTNYILQTSYKTINGSMNGYNDFLDRLPKTMFPYIIDTSEAFNTLKKDMSSEIEINLNKLNSLVIELHHNIIKKGWEYYDLKLDNICYKINESGIKLYFIDDTSGLTFLNKRKTKFIDYLNLHAFIIPLFGYSILGQYNFSTIFNIQFNKEYIYDKNKLTQLLEYNNYKILQTNENDSRDYFNWIPFKQNTDSDKYTNFYVIQFVINKFRLIYFDDNAYHMSNINFNNTKEYNDHLFDNLDDIFKLKLY